MPAGGGLHGSRMPGAGPGRDAGSGQLCSCMMKPEPLFQHMPARESPVEGSDG